MKSEAKKFLRRMIATGGFIADGIYEEHPRFWKSNNKHSTTLMDLGLFGYLQRERLIMRDKSGRFLITEKGKRFAKTWWERIMEC
jgi:hypothetical protein